MTGSLDDIALETLVRNSDIGTQAKRLSVLNPARSISAIALQWLVIALSIGVACEVRHWAVYLCAVVVIGTRQHALGILMHEAAHYRLFANRTWNDVVSDLFCGLPIGFVTERFRYDHLRHHADWNGDNDPYWTTMMANPVDWHWPKSTLAACWTFLRDLVGLGAISFAKDWGPWFPWQNHFSKRNYPRPLSPGARARVYLMAICQIGVFWYWNLWWDFILLWIVPLIVVAQLAFKIRTMTEHLALPPSSDRYRGIRTTIPTLIERMLISPLNTNCHLAHHLFPAVPWYNLQKISALLLADPQIAAHAHVSPSYFGRHGALRGEMIGRTA